MRPDGLSGSGGSGGSFFWASGSSSAKNASSTTARGVAYSSRERAMISFFCASSPSNGSGSRNARLKSKSFRSTRTMAWNCSNRVRLLASKAVKHSPSFLASSLPTRSTIRVHGSVITALATLASLCNWCKCWCDNVNPSRYFRAPVKIFAMLGEIKCWNSSMYNQKSCRSASFNFCRAIVNCWNFETSSEPSR